MSRRERPRHIARSGNGLGFKGRKGACRLTCCAPIPRLGNLSEGIASRYGAKSTAPNVAAAAIRIHRQCHENGRSGRGTHRDVVATYIVTAGSKFPIPNIDAIPKLLPT